MMSNKKQIWSILVPVVVSAWSTSRRCVSATALVAWNAPFSQRATLFPRRPPDGVWRGDEHRASPRGRRLHSRNSHSSNSCYQEHRMRLQQQRQAFETSRGETPNPPSLLALPVLDPLVVCGPSGVGKGTIIARFTEQQAEQEMTHSGIPQFDFAVSHTTRSPRTGEINGVHYHFVSPDEMNILLAAPPATSSRRDSSFFLEHATVHGNTYGTSWDALWCISQNAETTIRKALLDIDVQGVQRLKALESKHREDNSLSFRFQPKYIFIAPPSLETLRQRLQARGTESEESLARRTSAARSELEYGYSTMSSLSLVPTFDAIIINDTVEQAVQDFTQAVRTLYTITGEQNPTVWQAIDADNA